MWTFCWAKCIESSFCYARIPHDSLISCQNNSIRSRQTRGRGQWIGRITEGSIEVELAPKRWEADANPEITFEQTFLILVSGRNAECGRISNLLNLGLRRKRNGYTISRSHYIDALCSNGSFANSGEILRPWSARIRYYFAHFIALPFASKRKRHRGEWKIKKPRILIEW